MKKAKRDMHLPLRTSASAIAREILGVLYGAECAARRCRGSILMNYSGSNLCGSH